MLYHTNIDWRAETTCSFEFMQKRPYIKFNIPSWFKALENLGLEETYLIYITTLKPAMNDKTEGISPKIRNDENLSTLLLLSIQQDNGIWRVCAGKGVKSYDKMTYRRHQIEKTILSRKSRDGGIQILYSIVYYSTIVTKQHGTGTRSDQ